MSSPAAEDSSGNRSIRIVLLRATRDRGLSIESTGGNSREGEAPAELLERLPKLRGRVHGVFPLIRADR